MIVDTTAGKVEGIQKARVLQFRGIPYATAERFRPPEAPDGWAGVRKADTFGKVAPQSPSPTDQLLGQPPLDTDEDCLFLNVYTSGINSDANRPVMVWIHGGGFTRGSGTTSFYNGSNLAATGDVVVVTLNYRLGALGFLHLDGVLDDFTDTGANGIRDQIAALRWVQDNIANFGGDPRRVTVFGESAGAMSVATLLTSPEARGLFQAAITQSGAVSDLLHPEAAATVTERLLDDLGLSPSDAHRLRDMSADELTDAQTRTETYYLSSRAGKTPVGTGYLQLPFQPVMGGNVVPEQPLEAIRGGSAANVALVAGTTRDEWNLFMLPEMGRELSDDHLRRRAGRLIGDNDADAALELYRQVYPNKDNRAVWGAMATDQVFRIPAIRLAEAQLANSSQVAMYRFDYPSAAFGGVPGACHAIEIPFVFDNLDAAGVDMLLGGVDDGTRVLAKRCAQAWLSVAHNAEPGHDGSNDPSHPPYGIEWPAYGTDTRATAILDREPRVELDPDGEIRAFWEAL